MYICKLEMKLNWSRIHDPKKKKEQEKNQIYLIKKKISMITFIIQFKHNNHYREKMVTIKLFMLKKKEKSNHFISHCFQ